MMPERPEVIGFDHYDFAIFAEGSLHQSEDQRCHEYQFNEDCNHDISSLKTIWDKLEKNVGQKSLVSPQKLRNIIKKGIPRKLRGDFWQILVGSKMMKNNAAFNYQEKLAEVRKIMVDRGVTEYDGKKTSLVIGRLIGSFEDEGRDVNGHCNVDEDLQKKLTSFRQILLDTDRTFPSHRMFMDGTPRGKEGRAALFRVLAVYSLYNPQVSYCQGMSFIAAMLLINMCEEDAFWMMVSLFERPKYLSGYFDTSLSKISYVTTKVFSEGFLSETDIALYRIQRHSQVFGRFLRQKMPKLYRHLKSHGIDPLLYIPPWFMALFTGLPCWDSVLCIWDLLLLDGISVIFQVSLAILHVLSDQLLAHNDMSSILPLLLRLPSERINRCNFVPIIWRWNIYSWEVDAVLAIISDAKSDSTSSNREPDMKRKNVYDDNGRVKKIPRLEKENTMAIDRKKPSSLFQKFTKFVVDCLPTSLKENVSTNLIINTEREGRSSTSCFSFSSEPTASTTNGVARPSPRKGRKRHVSPSDNALMIQKLRITSPLRRSPRIAVAPSSPKCFNSPSKNEAVSSSPNARHAFKMFNTPTPLRISQISKTPRLLDSADSSVQPHFSLSPDVELHKL